MSRISNLRVRLARFAVLFQHFDDASAGALQASTGRHATIRMFARCRAGCQPVQRSGTTSVEVHEFLDVDLLTFLILDQSVRGQGQAVNVGWEILAGGQEDPDVQVLVILGRERLEVSEGECLIETPLRVLRVGVAPARYAFSVEDLPDSRLG